MAKKVKEEKIECLVCGISVTKHNLRRHAKSKKHKENGLKIYKDKPKNSIKERAKTVPIEIKNKVDEQMKNAKTSFFKRIYNKINTWLNNNGF